MLVWMASFPESKLLQQKRFQESLQSAPAQQQWEQLPQDPRVCCLGATGLFAE